MNFLKNCPYICFGTLLPAIEMLPTSGSGTSPFFICLRMAGGKREPKSFSVFNLSCLHGNGIMVMARMMRICLPVSVDFLVVES